ncbi:MAG: biotin/lipoyl-binding protein, partial [Planctomycetia bacterium]
MTRDSLDDHTDAAVARRDEPPAVSVDAAGHATDRLHRPLERRWSARTAVANRRARSAASLTLEREADLPALRLVKQPRFARRFARLLFVVLALLPIALMFVPWQQTVVGGGRVIALHPMERQQTIDAAVPGRIVNCWVEDGSKVKKGDKLLEIADNDPEIVLRLEEELQAGKDKVKASTDKIASYDAQILELKAARDEGRTAAVERVEMATQKVRATDQRIDATKAEIEIANINFQRVSDLLKDGLESRRSYELADLKVRTENANLLRGNADLSSDKSDLAQKKSNVNQVVADADARIASALA